MPPKIKKPVRFTGFEKMIDYAHSYVYSITRLRKHLNQTVPVPLGTAFLGGEHRLITCAHCINNPRQASATFAQHRDEDVYMLINKDQYGNYQTSFISPKLNKDLYVFQDIDIAIFQLPDDFYQVNGSKIRNPKNHLIFEKDLQLIGSEVGVIGYPLQEVFFMPSGDINYDSLIVRVDKGVINTRYNNGEGNTMYEFTMAFNPGNSGGPILSTTTGTVVGIVHGFSSHAIKLGNGAIDWRSYSQAYAAENLKRLRKAQSLVFN
jgi:hypothetical protein